MLVDINDLEFNTANVTPESVIIINLHRSLPEKTIRVLSKHVKRVFPNNRVLFMDNNSATISIYNVGEDES